MSEGVLFADPYRSLDSIAGPTSPNVLAIMQRDAANGAPAERRPRRSVPLGGAPGRPGNRGERAVEAAGGRSRRAAGQSRAPSSPTDAAAAAAADNEAKPPPPPPPSRSRPRPTAARLQKELELQIAPPGAARLGPAVDVKATDEGLLISLTDKMNFTMFAIGSAEPQPQLIQAMDAIAGILKQQPGLVVVRGHTDAHPYKSPTYDNWRLSSARAQMAYYMLTRAGLPESRFERIEGYADKRLRDPAHPFAAENRRIEILLKGAKP